MRTKYFIVVICHELLLIYKKHENRHECEIKYNQRLNNRTLGPLEGRGGYSVVHIPAGPIAPIGTQWHVFYLPLPLNTILCVLKTFYFGCV